MELQILSACMMDRGCFNLVDKYIESKEITPEGQRVLKAINDYYTRDPVAKNADRELIEGIISRSIPDHQAKHRELFTEFFKRIPREVSPDNLSEFIIQTKQDRIGAELHQALLERRDRSALAGLMDKWREVGGLNLDIATREEVYTGWNVKDLVQQKFDPKGLIGLLPATLNKRVDGGAKPGHHILVFAPTELGKTLFCVNMVCGFLRQGKRVLYVGNEDPIADINMRLINRITKKDKHQVRAEYDKLDEELTKANYKNFTIAGLSPGNFDSIRELTSDLDPHVVVLDQIGNLDMGKVDGQTYQLLQAAKAARTLGKAEARLMVSVAQAANNAYGKLNLQKNDVQWSNVDVPAQMDLICGIGANEEMEAIGQRRISLPKNKLSGNHDYFDVQFIKEYSEVKDITIH